MTTEDIGIIHKNMCTLKDKLQLESLCTQNYSVNPNIVYLQFRLVKSYSLKETFKNTTILDWILIETYFLVIQEKTLPGSFGETEHCS